MLIKKTLTTVALLASLLGASAAFAHAHLKSATPAADSTVAAPKDVRLTFSEGIEATFTNVSLSKDGTEVAVKGLETPDADKKVLVVTPAAPLAAGTYKVEWHAVSVDTHKSEGRYSFKVGQ
ncbi:MULTISPECIES: copper homeostasis periplasmic binding protein CopC [unclassified Pseudomonas]|uniref:copper homeostasis periplasmic binding protein CopC n=1 Tax=unclassified Pseudomonas TaxID=196821 RepID=UPI0011EEC332|nr:MULTISPECIES: copper homeostasis periplasmic binding protein CopC [unclassified Pseudomonas]KAA0945639.1 copper homeostasis periplasmic binding protein CopC [Pseudomonas sp. ANT_H4]KAA0946475.1 copper homeostasis periplasmic binding protein CopC [Pseudomonas sp. ANT_H14]